METKTKQEKLKATGSKLRISGAEAVIRCLLAEDANLIYGYPGGAIMPIYDEIYKFQNSWDVPKEERSEINLTSDGTLTILSSINTPLFAVKFLDMFPTSLSDINFDSTLTNVEYLTAEVSFKYLNYTIEPFDCC